MNSRFMPDAPCPENNKGEAEAPPSAVLPTRYLAQSTYVTM